MTDTARRYQAGYLDPATWVILGSIILFYLYRVIRWKPH